MRQDKTRRYLLLRLLAAPHMSTKWVSSISLAWCVSSPKQEFFLGIFDPICITRSSVPPAAYECLA